MEDKVKPEDITCGLWKDNRAIPWLWLINDPTRYGVSAIEYSVVFGSERNIEKGKIGSFILYSRERFLEINEGFTFTRML